MAETLKVLGQLKPAGTTLSTLYTAPPATTVSVSSLSVCNTTNVNHFFRISVAIGGAGDDLKQYLYYNLPIVGTDTFVSTIGISMGPGDEIRVYSDDGSLAFSVFGIEVT